MSTWFSERLACAGCGHAFTARMAHGIHATRVPHVRAQILRGELHVIACPACGVTTDVEHGQDIVYTDFERAQWVRVVPGSELACWAAAEAETTAQFERVMAGAPVVASIAGKFRVRVVFDLDELRERLAIWDAELDDAIVECIKLVCVRERPDLAVHGHRIRVRAIAATGALELASVPHDSPRHERVRWEVPAGIVSRMMGEGEAWRARSPELFERGFVSIDRYLLEPAAGS